MQASPIHLALRVSPCWQWRTWRSWARLGGWHFCWGETAATVPKAWSPTRYARICRLCWFVGLKFFIFCTFDDNSLLPAPAPVRAFRNRDPRRRTLSSLNVRCGASLPSPASSKRFPLPLYRRTPPFDCVRRRQCAVDQTLSLIVSGLEALVLNALCDGYPPADADDLVDGTWRDGSASGNATVAVRGSSSGDGGAAAVPADLVASIIASVVVGGVAVGWVRRHSLRWSGLGTLACSALPCSASRFGVFGVWSFFGPDFLLWFSLFPISPSHLLYVHTPPPNLPSTKKNQNSVAREWIRPGLAPRLCLLVWGNDGTGVSRARRWRHDRFSRPYAWSLPVICLCSGECLSGNVLCLSSRRRLSLLVFFFFFWREVLSGD